ncbi:hypothetical protein EI94DRAFT_1702356 [Lactarius quietus]|nr:hypothetical protein EI94DRAFT_1702356 [Lactarius quietus]
MYPDMIGTVNGTPTFHFSSSSFTWTTSLHCKCWRFLPSPVVGPVEVAGSAPGQQGICTPSTASSAHASVPCTMPVPTAATRGVKQHTDASGLMASASPGPMASATPGLTSSSAPIVAAQPAQHPAPYNFLQHIPASQRMARDWTASLVRTNMEVDADPQPPVADDIGPESEEEDREMEDDSRQELPVPSSTLAPWPRIRIPVHLPRMPADTVLTKSRPCEGQMLTHSPVQWARHQALDDVPVIQGPMKPPAHGEPFNYPTHTPWISAIRCGQNAGHAKVKCFHLCQRLTDGALPNLPVLPPQTCWAGKATYESQNII